MSKRRYWVVGCLLCMATFIAAFIYPPISRAKARTNQTSCVSNLKQLALGMIVYAQDSDERLPNMLVWVPATMTSLKNNTSIYVCPQDRRCPWGYELTKDEHTNLNFISYDALQKWSHQTLPPRAQAGQRIVLYEVGRRGLDYRHFGGMKIGFLDGHVKWYSREEMTPEIILRGVVAKGQP
ncbi:MAG: hypothetical protein ABFE07_26350 [Armatimonadia bacterium]